MVRSLPSASPVLRDSGLAVLQARSCGLATVCGAAGARAVLAARGGTEQRIELV